ALTTQPQVEARDALGKVDTDISLIASLAIAPSGTLTNSTATSGSGVAMFSGLVAAGVGTQRALTVSGGSLSSGVSSTFDVVQARASVSFQGSGLVVFDGRSKTLESVISPSGLTVQTTYNGSSTAPTAPGTYQVIATVVDGVYAGSATGELTIQPPAAPVAGLRAEPSEGAVPLKVRFTNISEGFGYTFLEAFNDDGQTFDDLTSVEVVYETPGVYEAVLTIKGQGGQSQTRVSIVVHAPPQLAAVELTAEGVADEELVLSLTALDVEEGNWSVAAVDSELIEKVEIKNNSARFVPGAGAEGTASVDLLRTNAWGLNSSLKVLLTWLPAPLVVADSSNVEMAEGAVADNSNTGEVGGAPDLPIGSVTAGADSTGANNVGTGALAATDSSAFSAEGVILIDKPIDEANGETPDASDSVPSTGGDTSTGVAVDVGDESGLSADGSAPAGDGTSETAGGESGPSAGGDDGQPATGHVDDQGQPVRGLFNGDMVVDLDDFFLFASHFGLAAGQDGFDPDFDLDQNGVINLADFFILADNFGREAIAPF
ncbi:MAG: PKD repeat protein, partial [Candidatus Latescibacterota bacterium]